MNSKRKTLTPGIRASLIGLAMLGLLVSGWVGGAPTRADNTHFSPPFDFSDAFYLENGVNSANLIVRVGTPSRPQNVWVLDNSNTDPRKSNIRNLETAAAFDIDGNLTYFNVMAVLDPSAFTNDPAGVRARTIADSFRAFFFPKTARNADGSIVEPVSLDFAVTSRRQDNTFETKTAYFCQNLVGFWVADFVIYTKEALKNKNKAFMDNLANLNGLDADGTPILKRVAEVDDLLARGFVEIRQNPFTGGAGTRWLICPDILDPRQGAIAPDAFLLLANRVGGADVTPAYRSNFICLQSTGNFCTCRTQFCAQ
jgi:hypothetical protein